MARTYKICSPHVPGVGAHGTSPRLSREQVATNERVDNVRIMPLALGAPGLPRAAVVIMKLWDNGKRLRVKFLDGVPEVQNKVAAIAKEWEDVANIAFDFVTGAAEIRVSFAEIAVASVIRPASSRSAIRYIMLCT